MLTKFCLGPAHTHLLYIYLYWETWRNTIQMDPQNPQAVSTHSSVTVFSQVHLLAILGPSALAQQAPSTCWVWWFGTGTLQSLALDASALFSFHSTLVQRSWGMFGRCIWQYNSPINDKKELFQTYKNMGLRGVTTQILPLTSRDWCQFNEVEAKRAFWWLAIHFESTPPGPQRTCTASLHKALNLSPAHSMASRRVCGKWSLPPLAVCSHVCIFRISSTLEKKDQVLLSLDLLECQLDIVVGDSVLFRFWVHKNWLTLKAGQNLMAFILISIINRLVCLQKLHDLIWGHVHTRHIELSVVFAPLLVRCFNNRLWLSWTKSCKLDCRFVALLTACFEPCHDKNASPLQKRGFRPFIYKKLSGCRLLLLFA